MESRGGVERKGGGRGGGGGGGEEERNDNNSFPNLHQVHTKELSGNDCTYFLKCSTPET